MVMSVVTVVGRVCWKLSVHLQLYRDIHPSGLRGKPHSCLGEKGVITSHAYYTQVKGSTVTWQSGPQLE